MKKAEKLIAFLLCIVLCLAFSGCGEKNPESEPPITDVETDDGVNRDKITDYIVKDGETEYKVVCAADATSAETFAAGELVTFIGQSTGISLPLTVDTAVSYDENGKYISVGNTALAEKAGIDPDAQTLNYDGFVITTVGKNMYIAAANDRGVIYGVYDFLEKILGIRFIASDETYVPELDTVPLYEMNVTEVPAFKYRNLYSYSMRTDDKLYTRLRFNAPERSITEMYGGRTDWYTAPVSIAHKYDSLKAMYPHYPEFNVIHNAFYWVSPAEYYDEHPEFFAADENGNTIRDAAGTICQLNLLNGMTDDGELDESMEISVAKVALESLKSFVLDDEDAEIFFFGHNDWPVYDRTPRSAEAAKLYGGQSGILIRFVNMLSREINKWLAETGSDREVTIATWAYLHTKEAPVTDDGNGGYKAVHESVIPAENVAIRMAPIELDWYYSVNDENQLAEYGNLIKQWTYICDNFMVWTYETNFGNYLFYYPSMRQWADNVRYFREIGVTYLMMQDNYHGFGSWQAEMHTYVASKLLWDPDLKVQPLIDEFLRLYFGENGAKFVGELMDLFDDWFATLQAEEPDFWVPFRDDDGTTLYNYEYFPIELLEKAEDIAKAAIAFNAADETPDGNTRNLRDRRLTSVLLTPQAMILKNYARYYESGRMAYATEFIANAEYVGVLALSEVQTLINYKAELGVA